MTNIYDQHYVAFANVSAYVISENGKRVGSVAFKFPRDGAGRLYCYLHIFGTPMVRGFAAGAGYDKRSAAAEEASRKLTAPDGEDYAGDRAMIERVQAALRDTGGWSWDRCLEKVGLTAWQAV